MPTQDVLQQIDSTCRSIAAGRVLSRSLAKLLKESGLNEAEFRLLWLLRGQSREQSLTAPDQKQMAEELGLSPAQVSALVERLYTIHAIHPSSTRRDRRRQRWELDSVGKELLAEFVQRLSETDLSCFLVLPMSQNESREAA